MLTSGSNATSAAFDNIASAASNTFGAAQSMPALSITGTGGTGFVRIPFQSSTPAHPILNTTLSSDNNGNLVIGTGGEFNVTLNTSDQVSADSTYRFPSVVGTVNFVTTGDTGTVTNGMLAGSIAASKITTGTSGANIPLLNGTNTWSGTQTFGNVVGSVSTQSGTGGSAYTFASTDCGTLIKATGASAATYTVPNSLPAGCNIALSQETAGGQVTIAAGSGATFNANPHSYTKTFGQYAIISIAVKSNAGGAAAVFTMLGDGA